MLEELAKRGLLFGSTKHGQLISVQELLQQKLGRIVEFDEAVAYVKKCQFVEHFKRHSHNQNLHGAH